MPHTNRHGRMTTAAAYSLYESDKDGERWRLEQCQVKNKGWLAKNRRSQSFACGKSAGRGRKPATPATVRQSGAGGKEGTKGRKYLGEGRVEEEGGAGGIALELDSDRGVVHLEVDEDHHLPEPIVTGLPIGFGCSSEADRMRPFEQHNGPGESQKIEKKPDFSQSPDSKMIN